MRNLIRSLSFSRSYCLSSVHKKHREFDDSFRNTTPTQVIMGLVSDSNEACLNVLSLVIPGVGGYYSNYMSIETCKLMCGKTEIALVSS